MTTIEEVQTEFKRYGNLSSNSVHKLLAMIETLTASLAEKSEMASAQFNTAEKLRAQITTLEAANKGLVEWIGKAHSMLRAFRHSMDTEKPFPSATKLDEIILECAGLTTSNTI